MASSCMSWYISPNLTRGSSSSLNYSMYEPNDTCNKRYTKFVELVIVFVVLYYSSWLNLYVVDGLAKENFGNFFQKNIPKMAVASIT
jgi:hypothetical protein